MKRSSTKELVIPLENPKRVFYSKRRLFETPGLVESNSPEFDLFSDIEERSEEEGTKEMMETMEQYMCKTRGDYGSGVTRPKINTDTHFELKGQFLKELRDNTFSGSEHEDSNEHIEKVLEIAQLNSLGREIKKVNEKVYAAQFSAPYQPEGQYRATGPGFYQRNNRNSSYPERRQTTEESMAKFMAESTKRHEENSNLIKEIRASTDAAIRNQGASIKTLEIQIGQISKVLQERGFKSLPSSTEMNPRDHVKSISTSKADSTRIRHMGSGPFAVSDSQTNNVFSKIVSFLRRLHDYCCDEWKEARKLKILETYSIGTTLYDNSLPQKEKDLGSFTLLCFIHNVCFNKALVDLGASVSVMPFSTNTNLGLGDLSHTRFTFELADKTIKHPRGIAKNVLVRIGKFILPIDFIILDIPEDDDVPLILGRPFLSTAHAKTDVFKRKITLRVGEEKNVFKSIKPASLG
ncbi:hypothetical protein Tco_0438301 [Tanacetum coccineum]